MLPPLKNQKNNLKEPKRNLKKEPKIELLILKLLNNFLNKDYLLASAQDLANLEKPMDISWKENNLNFIQRRLIKERNDLLS